MAGFVVHIQGL